MYIWSSYVHIHLEASSITSDTTLRSIVKSCHADIDEHVETQGLVTSFPIHMNVVFFPDWEGNMAAI